MKIGTVGLPLIGIEIKLAADGEVLAKGKNIMQGYYNQPEATAEVLKDGWLSTGDIGEWDGDFLKIIDRKKEMIKTSGGKYIVPQQLEALFVESDFIQQFMVVGEGRKFASGLVVPDFNRLANWLLEQSENVTGSYCSILVQRADVIAKIKQEIERINQNLGSWERIKQIILVPTEFSVESGELTPTLKLKRKIIEAHYEKQITAVYLS